MASKRILLVFLLFLGTIISCKISEFGQDINNGDFPLLLSWKHTSVDPVYATAVSEKWIAVGYPSSIIAIDTDTGKIKWQVDVLLEPESTLSISDNILIVVSRDQIKTYSDSGQELSTIVFGQIRQFAKGIYLSSQYLFVLRIPSWIVEVYDINVGEKIWEVSAGPGGISINFDPVAKVVYIATPNYINAYDVLNGNLFWGLSEKAEASTYENGVLYYLISSGENKFNLVAYDTKKYKKIWETDIAFDIQTKIYNLTVLNDYLIANTDFGLIAFNTKDGKQAWLSESEDKFFAKPVTYNDIIYAKGASSRVIYAIFPDDGQSAGMLSLNTHNSLSQSQNEYEFGILNTANIVLIVVGDTVFAYR